MQALNLPPTYCILYSSYPNKISPGPTMRQTADLELSIHRQDQQSYAVDFRYTDSDPDNQTDVRLGAKQQALVTIDFPALDEMLLTGDFLEYGKTLTQSFFADEVLHTAFAQVRATAQRAEAALRIRLAIGASATELYALRWETLLDPQTAQSLATDHTVYFSRYLSSMDWRPVRLRARGELLALAAIAAPSGLEPYKLASVDREKELATIHSSIGAIKLQALEHSTLNGIIAALTVAPIDILYLVAHGTLSQNNEPILWLEDEQGQIQRVNGSELVTRLRELENRPRLVVLVSCQSAGTGSGDVLSALGPRLAEVGIPAVLAMQGNIRMDTISKFMPVFFDELQKDGRIDRALNVARGQIRDLPDWWMPVLFMRLKSGRLWYTPGFSQGSASDYETEIRYIQRERCTPIIGPGLLESLLGPSADIARAWAEAFHYPMAPYDRDALPKVAQYLATDKGDAVPVDEYEEAVQRSLRKNFQTQIPAEMAAKKWVETDALMKSIGQERRAADPLDPYRVLARLPFPLYIVANPDRLLEDALEEAGRKPEVMVSPWNARLASRKTIFDLEPTYEPSAERPLVFYLFGRWNDRASLVLTEDEYIRYLIGFTGNKAFVPEQVRLALSDTLLLFLGFQTEEWAFRVIFHSILAQAGSELLGQYAHIAAQIEPQDERTLEPQRARRYLEKYFIKGANINIFWGRAEDYLAGLMKKWEAR